jgi:hypothetical protein
MKTCLIINRNTGEYCRQPADGTYGEKLPGGKLPACRLCLLEIRVDIISQRVEHLADSVATLAEQVEYPMMARALRSYTWDEMFDGK